MICGEVLLMAITFLKVKVINPEHPKKMKECQFLVDSGTVYFVVPNNILKSLGIQPTSHEEFTLADGEIIGRAIGNAYLPRKGERSACGVW
jgi:predicted aspartyl protease